MLLTTSGALSRLMELPSTGWRRRYRVRAYGRTNDKALLPLKDGLEVDGVQYGPIEAAIDQVQGGNSWLTVSITEGKNRKYGRLCGILG